MNWGGGERFKQKAGIWCWKKKRRRRNSPLQPLGAALVFLISSFLLLTGFPSQGISTPLHLDEPREEGNMIKRGNHGHVQIFVPGRRGTQWWQSHSKILSKCLKWRKIMKSGSPLTTKWHYLWKPGGVVSWLSHMASELCGTLNFLLIREHNGNANISGEEVSSSHQPTSSSFLTANLWDRGRN